MRSDRPHVHAEALRAPDRARRERPLLGRHRAHTGHFPVPADAPLPAFEAIAGEYPVFRIDP